MSDDVATRVREVGDAALVLEVGTSRPGALIDLAVNRRATAIAAVVRHRAIPGVRDVVPTFRSVAVYFDPLSTDAAAVAVALHESAATAPDDAAGRTHEVAVSYGGTDGPDLEGVAEFAGCSPEAVVQRHASSTYRVCMLGFLPGFAYLATVDETIAAPRRGVPRLRVPAGSVGIAGRQTGIYPRDAPGGWQIIGRAGVTTFDPDRVPPALFAPGDEVRFVAVPAAAIEAVDSTPKRSTGQISEGGYATVLRPGLLTTVQDSGRWGYQDLGVSPSGPMDRIAHRLANAIVGNGLDAATLEATWLGPELRMGQETRIALAGGDFRATLDGADVPLYTAVACRSGSVLRFGDRRSGARAYVAFGGGVAVPRVLGSRSTHLQSGLGGLGGRSLRSGDRIALGPVTDAVPRVRTTWPGASPGGARLRILPGPQVEHFGPATLDVIQRARYTISSHSDRMGYRLIGGPLVSSAVGGAMISDAAFAGGIQIPPSGDPILLMADRPTTGGYPQIAVVITADLPLAGQLTTGDWVEFEMCTRGDAIAALVAQEGRLLAVG